MVLDFLEPKIRSESDMTLNNLQVKYLYAPDINKTSAPYEVLETPQDRQIRLLEKFWCKMQIIILKKILVMATNHSKRRRDATDPR